ncbi:alpha/beta hydrolase [Rhodococcus sp. SRB_17]|uniref:alpha/beta fold hydrolase n=1 Tax=Rhodococcus sp. OK302 TaxID=1882769 RepID=UPI000B94564A|nr:alpha/beta hydrolase [Rhodococcus sp. OK302]NMM92000.1 alpha/beta hydrolase [Rhodococcus sp. SRB_17]OYD69051.1 pimeloyl-ACP methyl ester carboxylesterase [Rhodococcus sp. OK302]
MSVANVRSAGGVEISYRDSGAKSSTAELPPVVLIHGMGGDSGTWDRFARALRSRDRRVVSADLRGHGRSDRASSYLFEEFAEDVMDVCDHLEFDQVDVVGHSLGGHAASLIAQKRPAGVRKLVIEEAPIPLRAGDPEQVFTKKLPSIPELWHATTSLVRHPRAAFSFDRSMTGSALEQFRRPDQQWWDRLPLIEADTLFLRGGLGGMVDPDRLSEVAATLRRCEVVSFRTGHSVHRDGYREFESAVVPFIS